MSTPQAVAGMPLAPRRVPEAYVRAEVASFPLTSTEAFHHGVVTLDPELEPGQQTCLLWTACEKELARHASGWSLDRLIMVRDFFWFECRADAPHKQARCAVSMRRYLQHLVSAYLKSYPGTTMLNQGRDTNAFDAFTHYRWLTFSLPEDLLLAATPLDPPPAEVNLEPPLLLQHLTDRGAVEIHHHVGAGMNFSLLWSAVLARLADPSLRHDEANSPGLPFPRGEVLLKWLLAAAVARCVLAEFLIRPAGAEPRLEPYLERVFRAPAWTPARRQLMGQTLHALARGHEAQLPDFYRLRSLYADLHPTAGHLVSHPPGTVRDIWRQCDPIALRLGLNHPNGGERWLVRHGLHHLEHLEESPGCYPADRFFSRLFWQVQRVRCIYYRTVVQRPLTAGLQWFVRFYDRLGWARAPLRAARAEVSYSVAGRGRPLSALEVRISPRDSPFELARDLHELTRSWLRVLEDLGGSAAGRREPEFGVILHYNKQRDPGNRWTSGAPPAGDRATHAEPHPPGRLRLGGRFSEFFSSQAVKTRATVDLLRAVPQVLWLVRGLDVASDELGVPSWVLVPFYRVIHREATWASMAPAAGGAQPLRLTAHVGEDFRHLMEGLRRIFECIQYMMGRFGGRLGHGTALGVEPRVWAESTGSVLMTLEERLWDQVFEWRLYSGYRIPPELRAEAPPGRPEQVENNIRHLSHSIFRDSCEPQVLAELHHVAHRLLCRPESRADEGVGGLGGFSRALELLDPDHVRLYDKVLPLMRAYRENEQLFLRGQDLVDITLDASEVAALYAVQNALRRAASLNNLVVEVNPSSNLLIGDMLDLRNHPILRLFPPERRPEDPPPVPIAVGSDDPITFSTWLLHEYSLLHEAAITAGYPESAVREWLEAIQKTGMDARFTLAWRPTAVQKAAQLLRALEDYLLCPMGARYRDGPRR